MEANTESQHRTRHVKMELLRRDFAKMLCQKATDQPHIRPQNQAPSSKHSKVTQRLPKLQDTSRYIKQVLFSSFFKFPIFFNPFPFHFHSISYHLRSPQVAGASYQYVLQPLGSAAAAASQAVYSYVLRPLPGRCPTGTPGRYQFR
jgi:hypothetical protein